MTLRIGYHVNREGRTLLESIKHAYEHISKKTSSMKPSPKFVFQVFIAGPRSFTLHTVPDSELEELASFLRDTDTLLVIHGTYLDRPFDGNKQALKSVVAQMNVAEKINSYAHINDDHHLHPVVIGPIVHMSKVSRAHGLGPLSDLNKSLVALETDAYKMTGETDAECLLELDTNIRALIHTAGAYIVFDTAHIFESGINLSDPKTMKLFVLMIKKLIDDIDIHPGFHLNDSDTPLGSAIDRHEVLCRGHIFKSPGGKKALSILLQFMADEHDTFAILENPPDDVDHGIEMIMSLSQN
jgi:endonuclease IV